MWLGRWLSVWVGGCGHDAAVIISVGAEMQETLAGDSDRSQISLSEKSPTTRLAISQ